MRSYLSRKLMNLENAHVISDVQGGKVGLHPIASLAMTAQSNLWH
jgi:hypothetical protein